MSAIFIYVTCSDNKQAQQIASTLLESDLIACANIFSPHRSIYKWQGEIQMDQEVAMVLKSTSNLFETIREKICDLHSFECPCIVSWVIDKGHSPFLKWVEDQVSSL